MSLSKLQYEIRIKKENDIVIEFVTNIKELSDCFRTNENEIVEIYKVYEEDGEIVKSERLKCVLKGNRFSIVTIKEKPKRIKPSPPRIVLEKVVPKKVIINKIIPTPKRAQFKPTTPEEVSTKQPRPSKIKFRSNSKQGLPRQLK